MGNPRCDGETAAEALDNLEKLRRENYELVVELGRPIPLPEDEDIIVSSQSHGAREAIAA